MQIKTINKVLSKKLEAWLKSINNDDIRRKVKDNLLVSGGSITSMLLNEPVNDYDVYIQDIDVLLELAEYYCPGKVLDGRKGDFYLKRYFEEANPTTAKERMENIDSDQSEMVIRYKNLSSTQVKLDINSAGQHIPNDNPEEDEYTPVFLSPNAISLTNDIQIVLRFSGSPEEIHKTFDFIHATNYFTFKTGLVTNITALESVLTKELKYQGSHYPLTSIIRMKKFIKRGWNINAGEILKVMFQISELDLKNPEVLEEQLIGVDIAYFTALIGILRGVPNEKFTSPYLNEVIDRVFSQFEETE